MLNTKIRSFSIEMTLFHSSIASLMSLRYNFISLARLVP
jgi:hypothetical protein